MQIEDRVFLVTGASSGIGLATAIALSDRGGKVALLASQQRCAAKGDGAAFQAACLSP